MTEDTRRTWALVLDVLGVLEQHGYHSAGNQQTEAVALIGHLARTYEGTQEAPSTAASAQLASAPPAGPVQPGPPADHDGVTVSAAERRTILAALDEAADLKRDRAANCADCAGQTCGNCQFRLRTAHAYDAAAARLLACRQASTPGIPARQPAPGGTPQTPRREPPQEAEAGR